MKKINRLIPYIISLLAIIVTIVSCDSFNDSHAQKERVVREEKPVTKVDITIDTSNSFNSFFMDSAVVNNYLAQNNLSDTLADRIKSFYNSRNYQFAWFSREGMPEHTRSFWNMLKNYVNYSGDSTVYDARLANKMEQLIRIDTLRAKNDSVYRKLEMDLTKSLYKYADNAYAYDPDFDMKSLEWYIPRKRLTVDEMTNLVLNKEAQFADANAPVNSQYKKLREALKQYKAIKDSGGWPIVNSKVEVMKKGYEDDAVKKLKKRLKAEGFLEQEDSLMTKVYDDVLVSAVNNAKKVYGYKPDGTAGQTFIKDLNAKVEERIQQILINMERMRWIPTETKDSGKAILVNIPEFKLHVYEKGRPVWDMDVVVGKEGTSTTVFTGNLKTVVFSPYWNVPPSISKKEIIPKGAGYTARNHYEFYNNGSVRQKPGPWNSLGLIKFLFPNSYNIYFHDSPAKSLFNRDKRYFSHGCVRLKEPAKLAKYVLNDTAKWSSKIIDSTMRSGKEKFVPIKRPIPVLITYFTAWVNDSSILNFREDIYGHDEVMAKKMFLNSYKTTRTKHLPTIKKDSTGKKTEIKPKKDSIIIRKTEEINKKDKLEKDSQPKIHKNTDSSDHKKKK